MQTLSCVRASDSLVHAAVQKRNPKGAPNLCMFRIPGVQQLSADRHFRRDASMGSIVTGHTLRGDPWLSLSSMGVGTYLGAEDDETDELVAAAVITSVHKYV